MEPASGISDDTSTEAAIVYLSSLRRIGLQQRALKTFQLSSSLRSINEAGIRRRHPQLNALRVKAAAAKLALSAGGTRVSRNGREPMLTQEEFFRRLAGQLTGCGVPFMVCGSLASSFHGEPRATNDIDLVVDPSLEQLRCFVNGVSREFYISGSTAEAALRDRGMYNVIDAAGGWKADLILRKTRPYSVVEFERRQSADILGSAVPLATPEDVILTKLEWSRSSGSDRQVRDALGAATVHFADLDRAYLDRWASELGLEEPLRDLLEQARLLQGDQDEA